MRRRGDRIRCVVVAVALAVSSGVRQGDAQRLLPTEASFVSSGPLPRVIEPSKADRPLGVHRRPPLGFELNVGQTDSRVRFLSRAAGYQLFLTPDEALLVFHQHPERAPGPTLVGMRMLDASPAGRVEGVDRQPGKSHYFIGADAGRWRANVPQFAGVRYEGIYPGVDLIYHGDDGNLEYDFVVAAGTDPSVIGIGFDGVRDVRLDRGGDLVLQLPGAELRQPKPHVYQGTRGAEQAVAARYILKGSRAIGFALGDYDRSRPLVIDPVLEFATYLGGSAGDIINAVAVDSAGNVSVTGETSSLNFPTTPGVFQGTRAGSSDVFVTRFTSDGATVLYSTYLGGTDADRGNGIAVDASGNAYVTGRSFSTDFPVTAGAFQPSHRGEYDAFITKLAPDGSALVYSTLLGGAANDAGFSIAVGAGGNAYVAGSTNSAEDFPVTPDAYQQVYGGGVPGNDVFVTRLNASGSALVYSTYLGGSFLDRGNSIAIDSSGNAYITGWTESPNFPTANAWQPNRAGGRDAFLTKLNPAGTDLVYSTFLGGSVEDGGLAIAVDGPGNPYITGYTESTNFPVTNAVQPTFGGARDAFVTKFAADGSAPVYSTFLGGSGSENLFPVAGLFGAIAVDADGSAHIAGVTRSTNFPVFDALQPGFGGGIDDAFVTKLDPTGSALVYSTYIGGSLSDGATAVAADATGNTYVAGQTLSGNFPVVNAVQPFLGGGSDGFLAKISGTAEAADLAMWLAAWPEPVARGGDLFYFAWLYNYGPHSSAAVTFYEDLPPEATFEWIDAPAGWSCTTPDVGQTGLVTCTSAALGSQALESFVLWVRVGSSVPPGPIYSTASAYASTADPDLSNNWQVFTTTVSP